jgi:peroxidase
LRPASSFADITDDITIQQNLSDAYNGNVNLVDAWVGGLAEAHVGGGMVGELFAHIISDQFTRLMLSDPFFYKRDRDLQNNDVLEREVIRVDRVNLADILRWNTNLMTNHEHDVMTVSNDTM